MNKGAARASRSRATWIVLVVDCVASSTITHQTFTALDPAGAGERPGPPDVARRLRRLGRSLSMVPEVFAASWAAEEPPLAPEAARRYLLQAALVQGIA